MLRLALGLITGISLSVLAGDLLYLYYMGAWYDPIHWIEVSEVVMLCILFVWGIAWMVITIKAGITKGI